MKNLGSEQSGGKMLRIAVAILGLLVTASLAAIEPIEIPLFQPTPSEQTALQRGIQLQFGQRGEYDAFFAKPRLRISRRHLCKKNTFSQTTTDAHTFSQPYAAIHFPKRWTLEFSYTCLEEKTIDSLMAFHQAGVSVWKHYPFWSVGVGASVLTEAIDEVDDTYQPVRQGIAGTLALNHRLWAWVPKLVCSYQHTWDETVSDELTGHISWQYGAHVTDLWVAYRATREDESPVANNFCHVSLSHSWCFGARLALEGDVHYSAEWEPDALDQAALEPTHSIEGSLKLRF